MNLFKTILVLCLCFSAIACFSQTETIDCSIFKTGKFRYLDSGDSTGYIIMAGDKQTEHSELNEYTIESKITWISACSYNMTMTKITKPRFPYKPGDTMKVDIYKIEGDIIYYTATVKGLSWRGRFKKLKD